MKKNILLSNMLLKKEPKCPLLDLDYVTQLQKGIDIAKKS